MSTKHRLASKPRYWLVLVGAHMNTSPDELCFENGRWIEPSNSNREVIPVLRCGVIICVSVLCRGMVGDRDVSEGESIEFHFPM